MSTILVDKWNPKKEDKIVTYSGRVVIIPFDKIFNENNDALNTFIIKKESYVKQLDTITKYINYFIKFYDDDNELLMQYLKLRYVIGNKSNKLGLSSFIKYMYSILFTDTMKEKISKMVEDNYYIDISSKDTDRKYNESLEFTNEHAKILMQISISMKIMVPIMFHYLNMAGKIKNRKLIYRFYDPLFVIFGDDCDIYNKLWIVVSSKVHVNYLKNKVIWQQREIFGVQEYTHIDSLLKDKIISETIFKYRFDNNIINFTYVNMNKQLGYFLKERYDENRIELSTKRDNSGLSGIDKLEINSSKIDESVVILSNSNINDTIKKLRKSTGIKISKDEIEYYKQNMNITTFQSQLVFYYFAKYFNGYRDLNMVNRTQYIKLLIILKKRLYFQEYVYLPEILTANIDGKLNSRTIRNDKFLTKIQTSDIYQSVMTNKYSILHDIGKDDLILKILSRMINTKFTVVNYDHPEQLGETIEVNQDIISEEFLNFLNQL